MTRQVVLWLWALSAALLVGCEVVSVVSARRFAGARKVLDLLSATTGRLLVVFLGWMWLGWHFFAR
jgi:hypothetical protein